MTDVFADGSSTAPTNPVEALVGPDKKFKTIEDLAKGKQESDEFIARLQNEMKELRSDLDRKVNSEQQLNELRAEVKALREADPARSRDNTNPQLTPDSIKRLIEQTITQTEANRTSQQNVQEANNLMVQYFGDLAKAADAVRTKATELGLPLSSLQSIAAQSPAAFQKIMLGDAKPQGGNPLNVGAQGSRVPQVPVADSSKEGTKAYYDAVRKSDPKRYWKPETQEAIFKAVKAGTYVAEV